MIRNKNNQFMLVGTVLRVTNHFNHLLWPRASGLLSKYELFTYLFSTFDYNIHMFSQHLNYNI